jgi:hypothetical protein
MQAIFATNPQLASALRGTLSEARFARYRLQQLVSKHSHDDDLLQLNDVILGAVCAARNGKHLLADYRKAKRVLALEVLEKSGLGSFERDSPRDVNRFTVWNMQARRR